jgi:hypothetical protein
LFAIKMIAAIFEKVKGPPMPPTRKMNLVDLMIVVAAMAAGLGLARTALPNDDPRRPGLVSPIRYRVAYVIQYVHDLTLPCVAMLSIAAVVLRLRRPRPGLVEMVGQPGCLACGAGVFGMGCVGLMALTRPFGPMFNLFFSLSLFNGSTVGVAWFGWWINRRWKAEPGWIDRLGRVLGVAWIALPFLLWAGLVIW